jgi:predicted metal-dependent enzyme (double-stranded beta helix superfamily)
MSTSTIASPVLDFAGCSELIERLDAAVALGEENATAEAVRATLVDLIGRRCLQLPDELKVPAQDKYARHLVYKSPDRGYVVVAMVWGPGQGTVLHDHDGVWCVEGVVEGQIEVVQHEALEQDGDRWRFRPEEKVVAGIGTAGTLIPPFEYHTIANALQDGSATVTLHVYGKELQKAHVFLPEGDGWYQRGVRQLSYD